MKHSALVYIFATLLLPAARWGALSQTGGFGVDIGAASMLSYNSAWSQTTGTDLRLGFGIGAKADFRIVGQLFSLLLNVTKNQLLTQRIDGAKNAAICNEDYFPAFAKLPGPCSLIQVRLSPLYWSGPWGLGISLVYNYFSDFTFNGAEIYNTKRSNQAIGPVAAFKQTWDRFTLVAALHFDYAILSQSPLASQTVQSLQTGVTLYAMYTIY